jgi:ABC-2 type transport system ATP-binding protein
MAAIEVKGLTKRFGGTVALDGVNFSVAEREIFGLVGPDGAGKTTAMRLLSGIMAPTSGDAWVDGLHIVREAEPLKGRIGYMSQRFGLYPDLTVDENIRFYADAYGVPKKERLEWTERLLAFSNLAAFRGRYAGNLSGGMKQKLGLACALIHTPKVLFLDEPTNGVDPVSRRDFWKILYQLLRDGVTIFVSTSYLDEAERCSRVALLHQGKILACDAPEAIKRLMPERILEARSTAARDLAASLRGRFPEAPVTLFGDRVHMATGNPERGRSEIAGACRDRGLEVPPIREVEPSLEDVFVSVLSQKGEGRAPERGAP